MRQNSPTSIDGGAERKCAPKIDNGTAALSSPLIPNDDALRNQTHQTFHHLQQLNVQFENLTVTVACDDRKVGNGWCMRRSNPHKRKVILNKISGEFRAGQLSAVMGPSGAGKSTLLNILAGCGGNFDIANDDGVVRINGARRDLSTFRKSACYIMQQDATIPNLTVRESMWLVAALKLPSKTPKKERHRLIDDIMTTLGLADCYDTYSQNLSGGQRKRLVIAQELLNNPPVMLLDEPTSGLDSAACLQCIILLKKLAVEGGRTIICSIHQPSARIFEMFDQLYMLAGGQCIYEGHVQGVVPYFASHGFVCPPYHNPADYITEIASGQFGEEVVVKFASLARHEKKRNRNPNEGGVANTSMKSTRHGNFVSSPQNSSSATSETNENADNNSLAHPSAANGSACINEHVTLARPNWHAAHTPGVCKKNENDFSDPPSSCRHRCEFPISHCRQFTILTGRTFKSTFRDGNLTKLRLVAHVVMGIVLGLLYYNVGNESSKIVNNAALLFFSLLFVMFASMMPTIVTFPLEINGVMREHLNYWYSLKMYCLAKAVADVPFQCVLPAIYGCLVYWLSGQPTEWFRLGMFVLCLVATSLIAQSVGFAIAGLIRSIQTTVFLGPVTAIPMLLFSGFFINLNAIPPYLQWLSYVSYIRYGFEAALQAVYGYDRPKLACRDEESPNINSDDIMSFCFWYDGKEFLKYMNVERASFWLDTAIMLGFVLCLRFATYFALKMRFKWSRMLHLRTKSNKNRL